MSLSTRIAIGPSRTLALAEAVMIAGAFMAALITAAAHPLADSGAQTPWVVAGAALVVGIALGYRQWKRRNGSCGHEIIIGELGDLSVRCLGGDAAPESFELTDASTVWPGFAVLSLSTTPAAGSDTGLGSHVFDLPVIRGEMQRGDARRLHRFMLWMQRGAPRLAGSRVEDGLG